MQWQKANKRGNNEQSFFAVCFEDSKNVVIFDWTAKTICTNSHASQSYECRNLTMAASYIEKEYQHILDYRLYKYEKKILTHVIFLLVFPCFPLTSGFFFDNNLRENATNECYAHFYLWLCKNNQHAHMRERLQQQRRHIQLNET